MERRGFTLIELIITMSVMIILMVLAVVNLRSTQANARDAKRASDVAAIARGLEQRYNKGFQSDVSMQIALSNSCSAAPLFNISVLQQNIPGSPISAGSYPDTYEIVSASGGGATSPPRFCPAPTAQYLVTDLPGTSSSSFIAPNSTTNSLVVASSSSTPTASAVGNNYMYQPLTSTNSLCTMQTNIVTPCLSFNLYYVKETTGQLITITSQHQQ